MFLLWENAVPLTSLLQQNESDVMSLSDGVNRSGLLGSRSGAGSLEGLISQQGHEGLAATFLTTRVPCQNTCVHVCVCYFCFLLGIMKMLYMAV